MVSGTPSLRGGSPLMNALSVASTSCGVTVMPRLAASKSMTLLFTSSSSFSYPPRAMRNSPRSSRVTGSVP